jgi:glyoxylase-like metal-dependent hydrolase (beta-lactamase superfamily II)
VINVNSQSHYWLGNGYFQALKIPVIAHKEAGRIMSELGEMQIASLKNILKEKADGSKLVYPSELMKDKREIKLGGVVIQLLSFGAAHTAGDIVVWLPQQKILFTGDIVFTERMLGIIPVGNSGGWVKAFDSAMALGPKVIVPGHGMPTDVKQATQDTRDYLVYTRTAIKKMLDSGGSLNDAVEKIDQSKFKYLLNFDLLARRNLNQLYTEMEQESF